MLAAHRAALLHFWLRPLVRHCSVPLGADIALAPGASETPAPRHIAEFCTFDDWHVPGLALLLRSHACDTLSPQAVPQLLFYRVLLACSGESAKVRRNR